MSEAFTLDKLANALRGMPRDAKIVVEAVDGTLLPVTAVRPVGSLVGQPGNVTGATGYTIVLVLAEPPSP